MTRIAYALTIVTLIGASAIAGTRIEDKNDRGNLGVGFVLLTTLQRS
jgi:hypothetical protein